MRTRPCGLPRPRVTDNFLNRELSLLAFNQRVLAQASQPEVPLLERLRFLTISSANLDEFFEIRMSRLQQQLAYGVPARRHDGLGPDAIIARVGAAAHELVAEQHRVWLEVLQPELDRAGIGLKQKADWTPEQLAWTRTHFRSDILPVLTPIGLDPAHPFPHLQNKNLALIVSLDGTDAFGRRSGVAVVQVPRALPRVLALPASGPQGKEFTLLSTVIQAHVGELFPGMAVLGCVPFRLTRDSDLWVAEEETDDLLEALRGELTRRNDGDAVRLEVGEGCAPDLERFLLAQFELTPADLYRVPGPVSLHRLVALCELAQRPDLRWPPHLPRTLQGLAGSWFDRLKRTDVLLHHPYDSAAPVLDLLRQAAADPDVLAIKHTLYRTGPQSPYVAALIDAARAGKDVTAVVELRARFDEAANIDLATQLQDAGANVVYGVVGHKTHAKMLLIVRREQGRIRRYIHLGTGNYHPINARHYTDISYLSADEELAEDVHRVFLSLTSLGALRPLARLLQAPFTLHPALLSRIEAEAEAARQGRTSRIVIKVNALTDPQTIAALYRASQAGVPIDLIVRGVCCLRPGVPGLSENIRVRSIIGRFLEHARVYWFQAGGREEVFAASADWMERSFARRVELAFPIENTFLKQRIIDECLDGALRDNQQAWLLQADGHWQRAEVEGDQEPFSVQQWLTRTAAPSLDIHGSRS